MKYIVKHGFFFPVFLTLLLASWQAQATDAISQGWVSIQVADQTREVREHAFQRGLGKMFIRISGDSNVIDKLQNLESELPESRLYVQQFSYQPLEEPVFDLKGELLTQRIKIRYNTERIEQYLLDNSLMVEGSEEAEIQSIVHIKIEAVNSIAKYNRVEHYLTQLSAVKAVNPLQTDGEIALFELVLRSSEADFLSTIKNDGRLLKVEIENVAEQTGDFQVNDSKAGDPKVNDPEAIVLKENNGNPVKSNNTKFNSQPEINATQLQPLTKTNDQTVPSDTLPVSNTQVNQPVVYQYRFIH